MATWLLWYGGGMEIREPEDRFASANRFLQRVVDSRPPPNEAAEANIRWGGRSSFGFKEADQFIYPTHRVNFPPRPEEEEEKEEEEVTIEFDEFDRETSDHRVENPEDEDQYVIVQRIDVITFRGPDMRPDSQVGKEGRRPYVYYRYTLHHPADE